MFCLNYFVLANVWFTFISCTIVVFILSKIGFLSITILTPWFLLIKKKPCKSTTSVSRSAHAVACLDFFFGFEFIFFFGFWNLLCCSCLGYDFFKESFV